MIRPLVTFALLGVVCFASPLDLTQYAKASYKYTVDGTEYTKGLFGYLEKEDYEVNKKKWTVALDPKDPEYLRTLSKSSNDTLDAYLKAMKGNWKVESSANALAENTLVVKTYYAFQSGTSVGADFHMIYNGAAIANAHWIQVVTTNHPKWGNIGGGKHHDDKTFTYIDTAFTNNFYYDYKGRADADDFYDRPDREYDKPHTWTAEVYLVSGPGWPKSGGAAIAGTLTVHGGVRWGWKNSCTEAPGPQKQSADPACPCDCEDPSSIPEPTTYALAGAAIVGLALGRKFAGKL